MQDLPEINGRLKPYILDFLRSNRKSLNPFVVDILKLNKIKVTLPYHKYKQSILMFFDSNDRVRTAIITDDQAFYTSLFYIEVLRKRRDNEAWTEIKNKFPQYKWIDRYLHFLERAPTTTEKYWELLTQNKEPSKKHPTSHTQFSV